MDSTSRLENVRFDYVPRPACVCGHPLAAAKVRLEIGTPRGQVFFSRCPACGSYIQSPQVSVTSLVQWYDSDDYQGSGTQSGTAYVNYAQDEPARIREAWGRFHAHIQPYLPSYGRVLEIGCATGSLLSVIQGHGHETIGIDLSPRFAEAASTLHGLHVYAGDFLAVELEPHSFDAVIMLGTASNMQDLPATLKKASTLLKHGGFILFNFPHADSLIAHLYGKRYWMFAPSVSNFMTMSGCSLSLAQADFGDIIFQTDRQQPSIGKLMHHSGFDKFFPDFANRMTNRPLPFSLPIPAVKLVRAVKPA